MNFLTLIDYIGTFAFAISGIRLASAKRFDWFGAYVVGFVTAVGGVLRDTLINEVPLIFRKEIYALACVFGGLVYYLCLYSGLNSTLTQIIGAVSVILIRILAVKYHISLPNLKGEN